MRDVDITVGVFGALALLINVILAIRAIKYLVDIAKNIIEVKNWLDKEMHEDSGQSLKDLALSTDDRIKKVTRDVESISRRINRIEGKVTNEE